MAQDLSEVLRSLGRIEGQLTGIDGRLASGSKRMDDHDNRLHKVEGKVNWFAGAWGMVGTVAGGVVVWLKSHS